MCIPGSPPPFSAPLEVWCFFSVSCLFANARDTFLRLLSFHTWTFVGGAPRHYSFFAIFPTVVAKRFFPTFCLTYLDLLVTSFPVHRLPSPVSHLLLQDLLHSSITDPCLSLILAAATSTFKRLVLLRFFPFCLEDFFTLREAVPYFLL